jgi:uncharacterized protein
MDAGLLSRTHARGPRASGRLARVLACRACLACLACLACAAFLFAWALPAHAGFAVPPLAGHVVDGVGALSPAEAAGFERQLEAVRRESGFEIVVFLPASLEGAPIEDVAYEVFNTWKLGEAKADNGVLLVVATSERRVRIETGRGVGGALTDVQSSEIIRQMAPLLQENRVRDALELGTSAITRALVTGTLPEEREERSEPAAPTLSILQIVLAVGLGLLVIFLAIVSPAFRQLLFFFLLFGRRGGGGAGGGGFSGGGGSSGGGGASGSY